MKRILTPYGWRSIVTEDTNLDRRYDRYTQLAHLRREKANRLKNQEADTGNHRWNTDLEAGWDEEAERQRKLAKRNDEKAARLSRVGQLELPGIRESEDEVDHSQLHARAAEHASEAGDFDVAWNHSLWSRWHHVRQTYPPGHEYRSLVPRPKGSEPDPHETIQNSRIQKPPKGKIVE
jgi:hypothetical protein